jgi:hypothetical protein
MEIIYVLSYKLAELLKVSEAQALGLFTLAIKDGNKNLKALSYEDCREVIQVPLKARLQKSGAANLDAVTNQLLQLLAQKQSLFVMVAR